MSWENWKYKTSIDINFKKIAFKTIIILHIKEIYKN
jgi:hypothetical protein